MTPTERLSTERLEEMLAGLDGVTPGPWKRETEAEEYEDQPQVYVCSPATHCDLTVVATMGEALSISEERKQADAAHIARCDPDTIRSLITELLALRSALVAAPVEPKPAKGVGEAVKAGEAAAFAYSKTGGGPIGVFLAGLRAYREALSTLEPTAPAAEAVLSPDVTDILSAVGHIGVDFGYGPYVLEDKFVQAARRVLEGSITNWSLHPERGVSEGTETMWGEVVYEGEDNSFLWKLAELGNRDGVHYDRSIELSADTFPEGTKLVISEPLTAALAHPEGEGE